MGRLAGKTASRTMTRGLHRVARFIDIHISPISHWWRMVIAQSMIRQGSSMIFGEGGSAAPSKRWKDFNAYFVQLLKQGISTHRHPICRLGRGLEWVRGSEPDRRRGGASNECARVQTRWSRERWAWPVRERAAGSWIDTDTLVAMCEWRALWRHLLHPHAYGKPRRVRIRGEAIAIGQRARLPCGYHHLKIAEHEMWGQMPE